MSRNQVKSSTNHIFSTEIIDRIINYCDKQPLNKWLLIRHIFDISYIGHIPCSRKFKLMNESISAWADFNGLIMEKQTVGDWDFIRFVKPSKTPQL